MAGVKGLEGDDSRVGGVEGMAGCRQWVHGAEDRSQTSTHSTRRILYVLVSNAQRKDVQLPSLALPTRRENEHPFTCPLEASPHKNVSKWMVLGCLDQWQYNITSPLIICIDQSRRTIWQKDYYCHQTTFFPLDSARTMRLYLSGGIQIYLPTECSDLTDHFRCSAKQKWNKTSEYRNENLKSMHLFGCF